MRVEFRITTNIIKEILVFVFLVFEFLPFVSLIKERAQKYRDAWIFERYLVSCIQNLIKIQYI